MSSTFLIVCLIIATSGWHGALAVGLPKTSGTYTFELCGGRRKCSKRPEFLGFNNKTCDAGVPPMSQTYGNTVGPLIRQASGDSKLWRWWEVKMTSATSSNGAPMATIKNIFPSNKGKPKCLGHYITDYYHYKNKQACTELPWAERVHLHAESRPWEFQAVPGTECFNIIDDSKPDGCLRYLSASAGCSEKYVHLAAGDDGSGLQRWRLVGYKGPPPSPAKSPPPPRSPVKSPPPPKAKPVAPQLISVSASSPTTGSVVFQPTVGASSCNVTLSKDGQTVTRTITSLNYPYNNFYPAGLASNTDYTVTVTCQLLSGTVLPAPVPGTLHTPPNSGHPAVINVVPTSTTSGNITIVPPNVAVCNAKQYEIKATPKAGGATQTFKSTSLTVALTGLTPGVQYAIVIDAICDDGSTTKPSDPVYFTPLKSTTPLSSPPPRPKPSPSPSPTPAPSPVPGSKSPPPAAKLSPPPAAKPSPPAAKPSPPAAKPSPPAAKPSPPAAKPSPPAAKPPPPPPVNFCHDTPSIETIAVVGPTITIGVQPPQQVQGTTSSKLAYVNECTYANGTVTDEGGNWLPATFPYTTFQLHISKPATCKLTIFVEQIGQDFPVLCNIISTNFTITDLDTTPGLKVFPPTQMDSASITVTKPQIGCDNMSFVVSSTSGGGQLDFSAAETNQLTEVPFPPGTKVTVQGICPDGSKTPTSTPVTIPDCASGTSYSSTTGFCMAISPPPKLASPPPPSPPPPVLCPAGQYNNGGTCTVCTSIPNCHVVTCTSVSTSSCTQCDVGYLPNGALCKPDPCASAAAGADIQSGNIGYSYFVPFTNPAGGNFPPGTYQISYIDGCMKYGAGQLWTVNAGYFAGPIPWLGWYIGTVVGDGMAKAPGGFGNNGCGTGVNALTPGEGCGFSSPEACIAYSKTLPPVEVTLTAASPLGVWLKDEAGAYADNEASPRGPPAWSVKLKGCSK